MDGGRVIVKRSSDCLNVGREGERVMPGTTSWSDVDVDEARDIGVVGVDETAGDTSLLSCSALVSIAREGNRTTGRRGNVFAGVRRDGPAVATCSTGSVCPDSIHCTRYSSCGYTVLTRPRRLRGVRVDCLLYGVTHVDLHPVHVNFTPFDFEFTSARTIAPHL